MKKFTRGVHLAACGTIQIGWYDRKSVTKSTLFQRLRFAEIVAAATIPFLSGFAGNSMAD